MCLRPRGEVDGGKPGNGGEGAAAQSLPLLLPALLHSPLLCRGHSPRPPNPCPQQNVSPPALHPVLTGPLPAQRRRPPTGSPVHLPPCAPQSWPPDSTDSGPGSRNGAVFAPRIPTTPQRAPSDWELCSVAWPRLTSHRPVSACPLLCWLRVSAPCREASMSLLLLPVLSFIPCEKPLGLIQPAGVRRRPRVCSC